VQFTTKRPNRQGLSCQSSYFFAAFIFAQRALAAADILALPAALILRLRFGAARAAGLVAEPKICSSSVSSVWTGWQWMHSCRQLETFGRKCQHVVAEAQFG